MQSGTNCRWLQSRHFRHQHNTKETSNICPLPGIENDSPILYVSKVWKLFFISVLTLSSIRFYTSRCQSIAIYVLDVRKDIWKRKGNRFVTQLAGRVAFLLDRCKSSTFSAHFVRINATGYPLESVF